MISDVQWRMIEGMMDLCMGAMTRYKTPWVIKNQGRQHGCMHAWNDLDTPTSESCTVEYSEWVESIPSLLNEVRQCGHFT